MKELVLDGAVWTTKNDLYDAFFRAVGAPGWHGRNFDALGDSIAAGSINEVEVPYRLVIKNYDQIVGEAKKMTDDFVDLVHEIEPPQLKTKSFGSASPTQESSSWTRGSHPGFSDGCPFRFPAFGKIL
jgi:RNAse (barnase) inhibitor barstar